ncbi:13880_t:CDS:1, partial [Funneliformis geosporum]
LSSKSHDEKFLAEKIEEVIEKIGSKHISAIVSDNRPNIKK